MKKRKGFTLIELLAVIVILALLVLIAVPAVTRIMTSASKNNFKNEVVGMISDFNKAYTEKMNKDIGSGCDGKGTNGKKVTNNGNGYLYLCMTLQEMVDEQIIKKNLGSYDGYIQMWVPDNSGKVEVYASITNGKYFIQGRESKISENDYEPSQNSIEVNGKINKPGTNVSCPSLCNNPPEEFNQATNPEQSKPDNINPNNNPNS